MAQVRGQPWAARARLGFTLMESLIASAILFAGVLAITSAITAGQKKAFEAEQQIMATLAADELMGEVIKTGYADLDHLQTFQSVRDTYALISVIPVTKEVPGLGVWISGTTVRIRVVSSPADLRPLVELEHFIPEPRS